MSRSSPHRQGWLTGFALLAFTVIASAGGAAATTREGSFVKDVDARAQANPPVAFAQTTSDLPVNPAVRFGRLANGMTFVIYKNKTPPGAAAVYMRVAAGSVMEQEDQRGLAHFIEHMAFNGSKNVPEGEMVKLLQRDGLEFGADTNAQTTSFQTVYMLNLPDASEHVLGDALFLMRETAGNITFDPQAIDRERGVILGEERVRATADYQAYVANAQALYPGSRYADRMPIGLIDVIKTAKRPAFVRFYNDFYRPEYTTVIVVGDVDPDRTEAEIRHRFSDWSPAPSAGSAATDYGRVAARTGPVARLFSARGVTDRLSVAWVDPAQDGVETKAKDFSDKLFSIATGILDERFARIASGPDAHFVAAGLVKDGVPHTAQTYSLEILPRAGQDRAALLQATATLREFLANGPTQIELDRALAAFDRRYREGAAMASKIPNQIIAGLVVDALATRGVLQSPEQLLAQWEVLKPAVTLPAMTAALKPVMAAGTPVLWSQGEQGSALAEKDMLAAWREAVEQPINRISQATAVTWPYTDFGNSSRIVSRSLLPDVGATRVTYANGVVLTVKQTAFEDNAVDVSVLVGDGLLGVDARHGAALFVSKQINPIDGGLGKLSGDDIREALAGKVYSLGINIDNNATVLTGSTSTTDFLVQMQLLTAFIADPGLRHDALNRAKARLPSMYSADRSSPNGVYALNVPGDLHGDDPRFTVPTLTDAMAVNLDDVARLVRDQLGHGPVEVSVVGDITPDEAIREVGTTLGALPPRPTAVTAIGADHVSFPTANLRRTYTHGGRSDQNMSVVAWPTADYSNEKRATALELLAAVMTIRELDQVREKQGASYSASAGSVSSRHFPGYGYIVSRATVRPDADDIYYRTVAGIADALRTSPISSDELNRARLPLIDRQHNDENTNGYWLALLSGSARDPSQIGTVLARERNLNSVTPIDIQEAADRYLDMAKALRIQIKPR